MNTQMNVNNVYLYLKNKIKQRKYNKRPLQINIIHIAKAVGLTYKQTRTAIDKLAQTGQILRYRAWENKDGHFMKKNYYQIAVDKSVDNSKNSCG